jgi:hypothetical protein
MTYAVADFTPSQGAQQNFVNVRAVPSLTKIGVFCGLKTPSPLRAGLKRPRGIQYFEQEEIDGDVFVFHQWPTGAQNDGTSTV